MKIEIKKNEFIDYEFYKDKRTNMASREGSDLFAVSQRTTDLFNKHFILYGLLSATIVCAPIVYCALRYAARRDIEAAAEQINQAWFRKKSLVLLDLHQTPISLLDEKILEAKKFIDADIIENAKHLIKEYKSNFSEKIGEIYSDFIKKEEELNNEKEEAQQELNTFLFNTIHLAEETNETKNYEEHCKVLKNQALLRILEQQPDIPFEKKLNFADLFNNVVQEIGKKIQEKVEEFEKSLN